MSLSTWLAALPLILDWHGHPIARPEPFTRVIPEIVSEEHGELEEKLLVVVLDVLAAHESGYRLHVLGDGGRSKGLYQTPRGETPDDARGQTRVAIRWLKQSMLRCPEHPLSLFATGRVCGSVPIAERYWSDVRKEYVVPL